MQQPTAIVISALVGAFAALVTMFLKDFVFVRMQKRHEKASSEQDVLRLYVAPLIASCEKLVWRFAEIFLDSRHHFLKTATLPLTFNEYKRQSTLYRIAVLLGWMRAIKLELNALPRGGLGFSTTVGQALEAVRRALGDGPKVEVRRLKHLCALWTLDSPTGDKEKKLAFDLERILYREAGDDLKVDEEYLKTLPKAEKARIVRSIGDMLTQSMGRAKISADVIKETVEQAIQGMGYRQALIYRDWQDAIGDAMLIRDQDSDRRFTIIGFEQFAEKLGEDKLWMKVFRELIVDIDFDEVDASDFRADQLRSLCSAVSRILIELNGTRDADLIDAPALQAAQRLDTSMPAEPNQ